MKRIINWISGLFKDERGIPSSKRFVGIVCSLTLCAIIYIDSYSHGENRPADSLVNAVALLAFGCLGLSSFDKFTVMKKNLDNPTKEEE